jgi:hypothetical protein
MRGVVVGSKSVCLEFGGELGNRGVDFQGWNLPDGSHNFSRLEVAPVRVPSHQQRRSKSTCLLTTNLLTPAILGTTEHKDNLEHEQLHSLKALCRITTIAEAKM